MQLNDIFEDNSIKTISSRTNISEENLKKLLEMDFEGLKRIKTFGFISILEREFKANLSAIKEDANEYYSEHYKDEHASMPVAFTDGKEGKSKLFLFIVWVLLGYASWYFFTQYDQKRLGEWIPFVDEQMFESFIADEAKDDNVTKEIPISKSLDSKTVPTETEKSQIKNTKVENFQIENPKIVEKKVLAVENNETTILSDNIEEKTSQSQSMTQSTILLIPINRLWFGLVNSETKDRDHFSVSEPYEIEMGKNTWLLATSSAEFSLTKENNTQNFNDAKEHYFKLDKDGIQELSKSEYVAQGGWAQW
ncbi:MAG: hypothetical protein DRQ78_10805 [Epsilonproteobacteria bacterium]|nr:MAG: hypothetical protein DRQ78_10805 [Campylobacterota bacterium]